MKINQVGSAGMNPYKRQLNKMDEVKQSSFKSDKVEISTTAKDLQHTSQIPAQREAKVEALKEQIKNGTYKIDADETAKSIINYYFEK
ncbi:negative regulator of flagellin synthesis FlgM [Peribacillus deserti]|uniref:Negative regulator of flagellin synthesis n=1 Tax=Peribacillus deserti TaxID=673318 RepID=A0ABS2QCM0_9BACI|nr:flagellar biosynthesis anti-sigma factor FlgM [Peribacillus deserti]MBM7690883.1 negative regulator of flagellin synthesis FlgM [Peribacillus deserti]